MIGKSKMDSIDPIVWIASFDIGKKNFAFCIEAFQPKILAAIRNIDIKSRYNDNGTPTDGMSKILQKVYQNGQMILYKNIDLTRNCDPKKKLDPETFHNLTDELDKYKEYWDKCVIFVIEEQMSFGKKLNKMAMKLGQHCYSYFSILYGRYKKVIEFPAYHKTHVLGAPKMEGKPYKSGKKRFKALEKPQRKKWSIQHAKEILVLRDEFEVLEDMNQYKKLDDISDCINQLQAFKYRFYVDRQQM